MLADACWTCREMQERLGATSGLVQALVAHADQDHMMSNQAGTGSSLGTFHCSQLALVQPPQCSQILNLDARYAQHVHTTVHYQFKSSMNKDIINFFTRTVLHVMWDDRENARTS